MPRGRRTLLAAAAADSAAPPATLPPTHHIMRVLRPAGNNLLSVQPATGPATLAELPARLRGTIWVRRGGFVVVDGAALNGARENKLAGEVCAVVLSVKEWRRMDYWPEVWRRGLAEEDDGEDEEDEDEEEGRVRMGEMPPSEDEED